MKHDWLIGFARNAADVSRRTSVKLLFFQLLCACEFVNERILFLFLFRSVWTARACWMVRDQHCMILISAHWVEQSSVSLFVPRFWLLVMNHKMWFKSSGVWKLSFDSETRFWKYFGRNSCEEVVLYEFCFENYKGAWSVVRLLVISLL